MRKKLVQCVKIIVSLLPMRIIMSFYGIICKSDPLYSSFKRFISYFIPTFISIDEGKIALNQNDPTVSGALVFGRYEAFEMKIFRQFVKPNMVVIDIGANVGCYTVIAAHRVGEAGKVIAFEPEPNNFLLLKETVRLNNFLNVSCFKLAITNNTGLGTLFLSKQNQGDHRIYNNGGGMDTLRIMTASLDQFINENYIAKIDLIKMDIQGAEGLALLGMESALKRNHDLVIFTEFWPLGLNMASMSPLVFLKTFSEYGFSLFEIRETERRLEKITNPIKIINSNSGQKYTNLLCVRGARGNLLVESLISL